MVIFQEIMALADGSDSRSRVVSIFASLIDGTTSPRWKLSAAAC